MALTTRPIVELNRLSICLQNTQSETPFFLLRDTAMPVRELSCTKHGSRVQTALGQLFSLESFVWFAKNQTLTMNVGEQALTQLGKCYAKPESALPSIKYATIWYDEASDWISDKSYIPAEDRMLEFMGFETRHTRAQRLFSERWDKMVLTLITG